VPPKFARSCGVWFKSASGCRELHLSLMKAERAKSQPYGIVLSRQPCPFRRQRNTYTRSREWHNEGSQRRRRPPLTKTRSRRRRAMSRLRLRRAWSQLPVLPLRRLTYEQSNNSQTPLLHLRHGHVPAWKLLFDCQYHIQRSDFKTAHTSLHELTITRQHNLRRRLRSLHGQRRPNRLRHRRIPRRQDRAGNRRREREEVTMKRDFVASE
jgi:hypothetical protein